MASECWEVFRECVFIGAKCQASTGLHPSSYTVGARDCFPWIKADHSHPCRAEVKNNWSYISTPPYVCMV